MKDKKQRYILTLKLETELYEEDILSKRFEIGRQLYNSLLGKTLKRYKEMIKTKKWRENQEVLFDSGRRCEYCRYGLSCITDFKNRE